MPIIASKKDLNFLGGDDFYKKFSRSLTTMSADDITSTIILETCELPETTILLTPGKKPRITGIYRCVYCGHEAYLEKDKEHVPPENEHSHITARMLVVGLDEEDNTFYCLEGSYYLPPTKNENAFTTPTKVNTVPYTGIYKSPSLSMTQICGEDPHPVFLRQGNKFLPNRPLNEELVLFAEWPLILATNAKMNENENDGLKPQFLEPCLALN